MDLLIVVGNCIYLLLIRTLVLCNNRKLIVPNMGGSFQAHNAPIFTSIFYLQFCIKPVALGQVLGHLLQTTSPAVDGHLGTRALCRTASPSECLIETMCTRV